MSIVAKSNVASRMMYSPFLMLILKNIQRRCSARGLRGRHTRVLTQKSQVYMSSVKFLFLKLLESVLEHSFLKQLQNMMFLWCWLLVARRLNIRPKPLQKKQRALQVLRLSFLILIEKLVRNLLLAQQSFPRSLCTSLGLSGELRGLQPGMGR